MPRSALLERRRHLRAEGLSMPFDVLCVCTALWHFGSLAAQLQSPLCSTVWPQCSGLSQEQQQKDVVRLHGTTGALMLKLVVSNAIQNALPATGCLKTQPWQSGPAGAVTRWHNRWDGHQQPKSAGASRLGTPAKSQGEAQGGFARLAWTQERRAHRNTPQ